MTVNEIEPVIQKLETSGQKAGVKAAAWLKAHWYCFLIGAAAGVLIGHVLWR
jgi:hypothetical protein